MTTQPTDWSGRLLDGRYRIDRFLAKGGMASVYLGEDENLGTPVVVKVPLEHYLADAGFVARFQGEIQQLISSRRHPNVVRIEAQGVVDGVPYFVLEHLAGGTLRERRNAAPGGRQTTDDVLGWSRRVATALDSLHADGVVHRDVKPANILFDDRGDAYLTDFGITKAFEDDGEDDLTQTGAIIGTPAFMAPEQIGGEGAGPESDQYALATAMYDALAGRPPYEAGQALVMRKISQDPPPVEQYVPTLPAGAARAITTGLARNPNERHGSCTALVDAFETAVGAGEATGLHPTRGATVQVKAHPTTPPAQGTTQTHPARAAPKSKRRALILALLLCAAAVAAVFALTGDKGDDAPNREETAQGPNGPVPKKTDPAPKKAPDTPPPPPSDTTQPVIVLRSPAEGQSVFDTQPVVFVGAVTEDHLASLSIEGTDIAFDENNEFRTEIALEVRKPHTVVLKATDAAGNEVELRRTVQYVPVWLPMVDQARQAAERDDWKQVATLLSTAGQLGATETHIPETLTAGVATWQAREKAEAEATQALHNAESWARANWKTRADTQAVVEKYRSVAERHPDTPSGLKADERRKKIQARQLHAHPDRTLPTVADQRQALETWKRTRTKIDDLIARHEYAAARDLIPESVEAADDALTRELAFWRSHTDNLMAWRAELTRRAGHISWSQTPDKLLEAWLADDAGRSEGMTLPNLAFAFAHGLEDAFWNLHLELGSSRAPKSERDQAEEYKRRFGDVPKFKPPTPPPTDEPNDTKSTATDLALDKVLTSRVGDPGDASDWYRVRVPAHGLFSLKVTNTEARGATSALTKVRLIDEGGREVAFSGGTSSGSEWVLPLQSSQLLPTALTAGRDYFFAVKPNNTGRSKGPSDYTLSPSFQPLTPGQPSADREPNDTRPRANRIKAAGNHFGQIGFGEDDNDWYQVKMPGAGRFSASIVNQAPRDSRRTSIARVLVWDRGGRKIGSTGGSSSGANRLLPGNTAKMGWVSVAANEEYWIQIPAWEEEGIQNASIYELTTAFEPSPPASTRGDVEPNNRRSAAEVLPPGGSVSGTVGLGQDTDDWFKVTIPHDGMLTVRLKNESPQNTDGAYIARVLISDDGGAEVGRTGGSSSGENRIRPGQESKSPPFAVSGQRSYWIHVHGYEDRGRVGRGPYTLTTGYEQARAAGDPEPNDSASQAKPLAIGDSVQGRVGFGNDRADWYRVKVPRNGALFVRVENTGASGTARATVGRVEIHDTRGTRIAVTGDSSSGNNRIQPGRKQETLKPPAVSAGQTYLIHVPQGTWRNERHSGTYSLEVYLR